MQRIRTLDKKFHDADKFHDGTIINAEWLNSIQEEISQTIEQLGGIVDGSTQSQLATSLVAQLNSKIDIGQALTDGTSIIAELSSYLPSLGFTVFGYNNGAGLPDSTTRTDINALLSSGIPYSRIAWIDLGEYATSGIFALSTKNITVGTNILSISGVVSLTGILGIGSNSSHPSMTVPNITIGTGSSTGTIVLSSINHFPTVNILNLVGISIGTLNIQSGTLTITKMIPSLTGVVAGTGSFSIPSRDSYPGINTGSLLGIQIGTIIIPTTTGTITETVPSLTGVTAGTGSFSIPTTSTSITKVAPSLTGVTAQSGSFSIPTTSVAITKTVSTLTASGSDYFGSSMEGWTASPMIGSITASTETVTTTGTGGTHAAGQKALKILSSPYYDESDFVYYYSLISLTKTMTVTSSTATFYVIIPPEFSYASLWCNDLQIDLQQPANYGIWEPLTFTGLTTGSSVAIRIEIIVDFTQTCAEGDPAIEVWVDDIGIH